jgi:hypothetical protein
MRARTPLDRGRADTGSRVPRVGRRSNDPRIVSGFQASRLMGDQVSARGGARFRVQSSAALSTALIARTVAVRRACRATALGLPGVPGHLAWPRRSDVERVLPSRRFWSWSAATAPGQPTRKGYGSIVPGIHPVPVPEHPSCWHDGNVMWSAEGASPAPESGYGPTRQRRRRQRAAWSHRRMSGGGRGDDRRARTC